MRKNKTYKDGVELMGIPLYLKPLVFLWGGEWLKIGAVMDRPEIPKGQPAGNEKSLGKSKMPGSISVGKIAMLD